MGDRVSQLRSSLHTGLIAGLFLLFSALVIYAISRPISAGPVRQVRDFAFPGLRQVSRTPLPDWMAYSLPDGLWAAALSTLLLAIWEFRPYGAATAWGMIALLAGLGFEAGQRTGLMPGTYDPLDMVMLAAGGTLPFLITLRLNASWKNTQSI